MRIGIDATALPRQPAGAGRYIHNLVHHLARIDARNHYWIFLKRRDSRRFARLPDNFERWLIPDYSPGVRVAWQILRPAYYARKLRLDVWHSPHYIAPRGLKKTALIVTIHDLTFFLMPDLYGRIRRLGFRRQIGQAARVADAFICVSHSTRQDLHTLFPHTRGRTVAIYSGVDAVFAPGDNAQTCQAMRQKYCGGHRFILFVGTLDRRKDLPVLVQAFARLARQHGSDHHLLLVGQAGNAARELKRIITQTGLWSRVHLAGYVPENELAALYRSADLLVLPSRYEGFGFPVVEAMASGLPAITTDVAATAEVAGHAEMLVPRSDPAALCGRMSRVLADEQIRTRLQQHGLSRAAQFTWMETARNTLAAYDATGRHDLRTVRREVIGRETPAGPAPAVRDAVRRTLIFSDIFEYPLRINEIHRDLAGVKIAFDRFEHIFTEEHIGTEFGRQDGFFYLRGRGHIVRRRLQNIQNTHRLLHRQQRMLRSIARFPFVQAVMLSGTVAFENVNGGDDIDLFLLVRHSRTWLAYLLLVLFIKLHRKRRLICINCLVGAERPKIREQNFFVAHQIAHLRPISGNGAFEKFWQANRWILRFFPQAQMTPPPPDMMDGKSGFVSRLEWILERSVFDCLENQIFRLYARRIRMIAESVPGSRIQTDADRIQLYTNDHQGRIMREFNRRLRANNLSPAAAGGEQEQTCPGF